MADGHCEIDLDMTCVHWKGLIPSPKQAGMEGVAGSQRLWYIGICEFMSHRTLCKWTTTVPKGRVKPQGQPLALSYVREGGFLFPSPSHFTCRNLRFDYYAVRRYTDWHTPET